MSLAAFTLVEILMAMAVSSILLVVLASMLESSLNAYSGQQRRSSATVESRAGLEILRTDLRSYCALPDDPKSTGDDLVTRFIYLPGEGDFASDRFAFLRRTRVPLAAYASTAPDQGNLALVAYGVGYTPDAGGGSSQKLYRRQFTADETYVKLKEHLTTGASLVSESDWKAITESPVTPATTPAGQPQPSIAEPVIFQLIQFKVSPLNALLAFPNDSSSINGVKALSESVAWQVGQRPAAVDILLRVTNRGMAARLEKEEDWQAQGVFQPLLLGRPVTPHDYGDDPEVETQQLRIHLPRF